MKGKLITDYFKDQLDQFILDDALNYKLELKNLDIKLQNFGYKCTCNIKCLKKVFF